MITRACLARRPGQPRPARSSSSSIACGPPGRRRAPASAPAATSPAIRARETPTRCAAPTAWSPPSQARASACATAGSCARRHRRRQENPHASPATSSCFRPPPEKPEARSRQSAKARGRRRTKSDKPPATAASHSTAAARPRPPAAARLAGELDLAGLHLFLAGTAASAARRQDRPRRQARRPRRRPDHRPAASASPDPRQPFTAKRRWHHLPGSAQAVTAGHQDALLASGELSVLLADEFQHLQSRFISRQGQ